MTYADGWDEFTVELERRIASDAESPWWVLWIDIAGMSVRNTEEGIEVGDGMLAAVESTLRARTDLPVVSGRGSDEWLVGFQAAEHEAASRGRELLDELSAVSGAPLHGHLIPGTELRMSLQFGEHLARYRVSVYHRPGP